MREEHQFRLDRRRHGAALVMALLLLVIIECVVVGSLHLSLQEHRIGTNRAAALALRLRAESAVRRALGQWSTAIDSMTVGASSRIPLAAAPHTHVEVERIAHDLFIIDAVAAEPAPRVGRTAARLLLRPPALPPHVNPALTPVSASGPVFVAAAGAVSAAAPPGCSVASAPFTIRTPQPSAVTIAAGAVLDAPTGLLMSDDLTAAFGRLAAFADSSYVARADTTVTGSAAGVLIVDGSLTLSSGAAFTGLLLVRGTLTIDPGAAVHGAVHAGAGGRIDGAVSWDPCAVAAAVADAALDRPQAAGPRAWLAAF
ncbi:MAG TPA: hypothetical protein VFZ69_09175 [Longimicrobiales bacterium]